MSNSLANFSILLNQWLFILKWQVKFEKHPASSAFSHFGLEIFPSLLRLEISFSLVLISLI